MAKKKTTTKKFKIVDLLRSKPKLTYIDLPKYPVEITMEVTTKGILSASEPAPAVFDRLEKEARTELERYEDIIKTEAVKLDKKIGELMKVPTEKNVKAAETMVRETTMSINNALASAEGAAQKVMEARLKKEAQGDKNLKEAQVRTGFKWTLGVISLAGNVAKLVATMGADVSSYVSIAKTLYSLGTDLQQQLKNEDKLRKDFDDGIKAFLKLRESSIQQAATRQNITDLSGVDFKKPKEALVKVLDKIKAAGDEITRGKDKKTIAKDFLEFAVKKVQAKRKDVETARVKYREHTTKTRHKTDKISVEAEKLMKAMKAAKNLKEGVRIGAECMAVKREVTAMAKKLEVREKYLEAMQDLMRGNGLEIDDTTTLQKIKALDKMTILTEVNSLYDAVKTIKDTIGEIADAVA